MIFPVADRSVMDRTVETMRFSTFFTTKSVWNYIPDFNVIW